MNVNPMNNASLSNTSTSNVLSQKINGHMQDVKAESKADAKLDGKLDGNYEHKCSDLNGGTVKNGKEEVNFKLLGQRKTNGGLEFMIECTEKE